MRFLKVLIKVNQFKLLNLVNALYSNYFFLYTLHFNIYMLFIYRFQSLLVRTKTPLNECYFVISIYAYYKNTFITAA